MTNINVNFANNTIEITNVFAKSASKYGTQAYNELNIARKDFPTFKVVVMAAKKNNAKNSKVTLADIKRYIEFHDDEEKSKMQEFDRLCNGKANGELRNKSFFEIKKWFFENFAEVA